MLLAFEGLACVAPVHKIHRHVHVENKDDVEHEQLNPEHFVDVFVVIIEAHKSHQDSLDGDIDADKYANQNLDDIGHTCLVAAVVLDDCGCCDA